MYFDTYPNAWILILLGTLISTAVGLYVTYLVLKIAIRDGIDESRLRLDPPKQQIAPIGYKWALVKTDSSKDEELRIH